MAYSYKNKKGQTYYLHSKEVKLRGNRPQTIYFFSRESGEETIDQLPEGYEVIENENTGLPLLRKVEKDNEN